MIFSIYFDILISLDHDFAITLVKLVVNDPVKCSSFLHRLSVVTKTISSLIFRNNRNRTKPVYRSMRGNTIPIRK